MSRYTLEMARKHHDNLTAEYEKLAELKALMEADITALEAEMTKLSVRITEIKSYMERVSVTLDDSKR